MPTPTPTPDPYARKWYVMVAIASGMFLGTIDGSIVNLALPVLERYFNAPFALVQWVVLAYMLTIATLMMAVGRLGDIIGKKPLFVGGFIIFTLGSVLCGFSTSIGQLIGFRMLQAVGAAAITGLGTAILTENFPPEERGRALGIGGSIVSLGLISGPTLGGLILGVLPWNWIFFVNLPIGLIGIVLVSRFVPFTRSSSREGFDFAGAASLFVTLLSLLLALTLGQELGFGDGRVVGLFALFAAALALFIFLQRRSRHPLIDLNLFKNRLFSVNLLTGFLTFVSFGGTVLLMPFFLQNVLGYTPQRTGLLMSVIPLTMGLTAPLAGSLSDRFGTRRLAAAGLAALLTGYLAASTLSTEMADLGLVLRFLPVGLGMGLFQSPNNSAIMGAAPRGRLGVASSLLALTRSVGQTTGIALLGALWAGRVLLLSHGAAGDATAAPAAVQAAALQQTILFVALLVSVALALSIWALRNERALATAAPAN